MILLSNLQYKPIMKKTYIVAVGLLFSVSANAQLLDVFKSAVKNQTGVDLSKVGQKNTTTSTTSTPQATADLSSLTSSQISSGLKEALSMGVTEGVKKLGVTDGFYKNEMVKILMPEKLRKSIQP